MRFIRGQIPLRAQRNVDIPTTPPTSRASAKEIPVYITNRDRLTSTRLLVEWLLKTGTQKIVVLDNASTYPPLLEYYRTLKEVEVLFQRNLGPWGFWDQGLHNLQDKEYIVTDSDLVPASCCPEDLVQKMLEILRSYPECGKVGPGLRLDNIPDLSREFITHGDGKGWDGEGVYWKVRHPSGAFKAPIDTTMAIYNVRSPWVPAGWQNLRLDMPYVVEHAPWYISKPFSEEDQYYRDHADHTWSHVTWPSPINDA